MVEYKSIMLEYQKDRTSFLAIKLMENWFVGEVNLNLKEAVFTIY